MQLKIVLLLSLFLIWNAFMERHKQTTIVVYLSLTHAHSLFYCNITLTAFKTTNRVEQKLRPQRKGKSPWRRLDRVLGKKTRPFPELLQREHLKTPVVVNVSIFIPRHRAHHIGTFPDHQIEWNLFKFPTTFRNLHSSLFKVFDWLLLTSFWSSGVLHAVETNDWQTHHWKHTAVKTVTNTNTPEHLFHSCFLKKFFLSKKKKSFICQFDNGETLMMHPRRIPITCWSAFLCKHDHEKAADAVFCMRLDWIIHVPTCGLLPKDCCCRTSCSLQGALGHWGQCLYLPTVKYVNQTEFGSSLQTMLWLLLWVFLFHSLCEPSLFG